MTVRDELNRLIALNHAEEYVPTFEALQQIEHFGDDLIPGLVDSLRDDNSEIRRLAVELLIEARPRSDSAIPQLIDRLAHDDDRLVQIAVLTGIGDFGRLAQDAIDHLHPWLDSEEEYLRILAAVAIMSIDEYRTELRFDIRQALQSENPTVRHVAREFFGRAKVTMPFDEDAFQESVRANWSYHSPCEQVDWRCDLLDDGTWEITASPVYQQVWAGEDDGKKVWAGFDFHGFGFAQEPGVEILDFGGMSVCTDHNPTPFIGLKGCYFGQPFVLRILLEPSTDAPVREVLDTVTKQVRPVTDEEDE